MDNARGRRAAQPHQKHPRSVATRSEPLYLAGQNIGPPADELERAKRILQRRAAARKRRPDRKR